MWQQIRSFAIRTIVALRSALVGLLIKVNIQQAASQFGLQLQTLSKTTQNKFTITLMFPDGECVDIDVTEHEWNFIERSAKEQNQTMEEFILAAIESAVGTYK